MATASRVLSRGTPDGLPRPTVKQSARQGVGGVRVPAAARRFLKTTVHSFGIQSEPLAPARPFTGFVIALFSFHRNLTPSRGSLRSARVSLASAWHTQARSVSWSKQTPSSPRRIRDTHEGSPYLLFPDRCHTPAPCIHTSRVPKAQRSRRATGAHLKVPRCLGTKFVAI